MNRGRNGATLFRAALSCNRNCSYSHYSCEIARSRICL